MSSGTRWYGLRRDGSSDPSCTALHSEPAEGSAKQQASLSMLFEYTHGFGIYHTDKRRLLVPPGNSLK